MIELIIATIVFYYLEWNIGALITGALAVYIWWQNQIAYSNYLKDFNDE